MRRGTDSERAMKLLRYGLRGHERPGLVDHYGELRDLHGYVEDVSGEALLPAGLQRLRSINASLLPRVEGQHRIGPCVGKVGKIIGVGLNYADHAAESGMPIPTEPPLFMKATSAIVGPNDDVEIPRGSRTLDYEVELGVCIGKPGRYIAKEHAMEHVCGFLIVNDVSDRAAQLERGGTWDKGKGHDTFAPIGPWLVTTDEIQNPQDLALWLDIDGRRFQQGSTRTMIFDVAYLVHYISQFFSLQSGDIISTGTPPGVGLGQKPHPIYLRPDQTMRLGIEHLGVQQQRVVSARHAE